MVTILLYSTSSIFLLYSNYSIVSVRQRSALLGKPPIARFPDYSTFPPTYSMVPVSKVPSVAPSAPVVLDFSLPPLGWSDSCSAPLSSTLPWRINSIPTIYQPLPHLYSPAHISQSLILGSGIISFLLPSNISPYLSAGTASIYPPLPVRRSLIGI